MEAFSTGSTPCESNPASTCTRYNVRGADLPAGRTVTAYCQFRTGTGGAWGPAQYPHSATTDGNGSFTGTSNCHVGLNTYLRYEVRVSGGGTLYTDPVTR